MYWMRVPDGSQWREVVGSLEGGPELEREFLEEIAQLLDRARPLGEFDRVRPLSALIGRLSAWSERHPESSPLRIQMQALWNIVLSTVQGTVVDLFPAEFCVVGDLHRHRYVTIQHLTSAVAVIIYHPTSRVTGLTSLPPASDELGTIERVVHGMTEALPGDWVGTEMRAYLAGGNVSTSPEMLTALDGALVAAAIDHRESILLRRAGEHAPLHLVFDRSTGRLTPFSPSIDPLTFGGRTRMDLDRSRGELRNAHPAVSRYYVAGGR